MPTFTAKYLHDLGKRIFMAHGMPDEEAEVLMRIMVRANLTGHNSHGVIHIHRYADWMKTGRMMVPSRLTVVRETPTTAVLDGHLGAGHYLATKATELAIEKARENNLGAVGLHNSNHVGRVGEYPEMVARAGMVGIAMANSAESQRVAPFGGIDRRLSTCPISIAAPRGDGRVVMYDVATSVVAGGKVRNAQVRGDQVPENWLIDSEGRPTTDPTTQFPNLTGAMLPMGGPLQGYKGFGLAVMVDLITGLLGGEGVVSPDAKLFTNGFFIMALNINAFTTLEKFTEQADRQAEWIKSARPREGFDEVLMPGEKEERNEAALRRDGITLDDGTWALIRERAEEVGLEIPPA